MNRGPGSPPHRRSVTLIEAVLYISVALGLIVAGLVFYNQASLAMKVMNTKRHIEAAVMNVRAIQEQTRMWNPTNASGFEGAPITDLLKAYGALPSINNGFGDMEPEFTVGILGTVGGTVIGGYTTDQAALPAETCGALVVQVKIPDVPVEACTRMAVTDETYQGFLSTGQLGAATDSFFDLLGQAEYGGVFKNGPITPSDAASLCRPYPDTPAGLSFYANFMLEPPTAASASAAGCP